MRIYLLLPLVFVGCSSGWGDDKGEGPGVGESDADTDSDSDADADTDTDTDTDTPEDDADSDGYTESDGDCDDADPTVHPDAEEICDGKDDDCDGVWPDEGDADGDGEWDCEDACPIQVDQAASPGGDGTVARPFQTIQDGIDDVPTLPCYEVQVHPGTYVETIDLLGYPVDLSAPDGPDLTFIDGGGIGPVVTIDTAETAATRVSGFTITGGQAARGGGIYVNGASPTLEGNRITGNAANQSPGLGGGLYLYESDATVTDNEFTSNDAGMGGGDDGNDGGGIAILYGAPWIEGNLVRLNKAGDGGGLWLVRTDATVLHNLIDGNQAEDAGTTDAKGNTLEGQGGGVAFQSDTDGVLFTNNVLTNNRASSHGGGIAATGYYTETDVASPEITFNTLAWNDVDSGGYGAGILVWGYSSPVISSNIVVDGSGHGIYAQYDYSTIEYNDVDGHSADYSGAIGDLTGVDGNLSSAPSFVAASDDGDGTNDDFGLKSGSVGADAGDPAETDGDGSRADMGAFGGAAGSW